MAVKQTDGEVTLTLEAYDRLKELTRFAAEGVQLTAEELQRLRRDATHWRRFVDSFGFVRDLESPDVALQVRQDAELGAQVRRSLQGADIQSERVLEVVQPFLDTIQSDAEELERYWAARRGGR